MFNKQIAAFLAALAALLLLCGCTAGEAESLPELIIGCENYEPYSYTDENGEPAGLDVELAREACRRMGYLPVFRYIDWNERDTLLESGAVDCLWSCYAMDEQTDKYAWVGPYMRSRQIVAVPAVSTLWSIEDLAGKRIAVLVGSKAERIFLQRSDENIPKVRNVYALNKTDELATALRNDYVDAIAGDAATVRRVLQNEEIEFRFFDEDLRDTACGIAFSKDGDAALREALAAAMTDMLHDGVAASILERYGAETDTTSGGLGNE